jgi:opacity protein-like surface antigen
MDKSTKKSLGRRFLGIVVVLTLVAFAANLAAVAQDQSPPKKKVGLSFKLSGGAGYLVDGAGDVNPYRRDQQALLSDQDTREGYTTTFDWPRTWFLPELTAEMIINIGPHLGVGFGTGFIPVSSRGSYAANYHGSWTSWWSGSVYTKDSKIEYRPDFRATAVPLKVDLYVFQPVGRGRITLFAYAGVGYYQGKLKMDYPIHETSKSSNGYDSWESISDYQIDMAGTLRSHTWGYQGGLGLELKMSRAISLGAELAGRYANFKNWEGDFSISSKSTYKSRFGSEWLPEESSADRETFRGSLWTFEVRDEETNKTYTFMLPAKSQPDSRYYENSRKSALNLNSLSLALSVKVHFDLF